MAAGSGRRVRISLGAAVIAGAKTDSLTINNEPIDVTDKDDVGYQTFIGDYGMRSMELSCDGILKGDVLILLASGTGAGLLAAATIDIDTIGVFAGSFFFNSFEVAGSHDGENTFTATFKSSGAFTYTAV
jgi:predicted secreted protein